MRQPRPNLATQTNNFYSQNLVNTDFINQRKCKMKSRYPITHNNMK